MSTKLIQCNHAALQCNAIRLEQFNHAVVLDLFKMAPRDKGSTLDPMHIARSIYILYLYYKKFNSLRYWRKYLYNSTLQQRIDIVCELILISQKNNKSICFVSLYVQKVPCLSKIRKKKLVVMCKSAIQLEIHPKPLKDPFSL